MDDRGVNIAGHVTVRATRVGARLGDGRRHITDDIMVWFLLHVHFLHWYGL